MSGKIPQRELAPAELTVGNYNHAHEFIANAGEAITKNAIVIPQLMVNTAVVSVKNAVNTTLGLFRGPMYVAMHTTPSGGRVRCADHAIINAVDTSGATILDPVYLTTAGGWTRTKPTNAIPIGLILEVHASTGVVLLCPNNPQLGGLLESTALLQGTFRPQGLNSLPRRIELKWVAGQRGKPGINADIQNAAEATREIADPDFEVLGVNGSSDDVTFHPEGGIKIETDGADGDEVIILPHLDANQSAWTQFTWGTDKETIWECDIQTGSNITNTIIWAGLKLTNTEVLGTDNDQVFFRYEDDVSSGVWVVVSSIGGVDTSTVSTVTVAVSTRYHLKVIIDSSRIAKAYINGVLIYTTTALTDATDFIPYIGVAADGAAAAKHMYIFGQAISRNIG